MKLTVKELIEILQKYDENLPVEIYVESTYEDSYWVSDFLKAELFHGALNLDFA